MKLWIANCTKQIKEVPYRLPGNRKIFEVKLNPGQQLSLPNEMSSEDIDHFVAQHKHYGLRDEKTIKNVKNHVGMLYSVGRPIDMARVALAIEENDAVLTAQSQHMLEQTLLSADRTVQSQTEGQGKVNSLEIVEERPAGSNDKNVKRSDVRISGRRGSE